MQARKTCLVHHCCYGVSYSLNPPVDSLLVGLFTPVVDFFDFGRVKGFQGNFEVLHLKRCWCLLQLECNAARAYDEAAARARPNPTRTPGVTITTATRCKGSWKFQCFQLLDWCSSKSTLQRYATSKVPDIVGGAAC